MTLWYPPSSKGQVLSDQLRTKRKKQPVAA
jgi:hypothetical protein